MYNKNKTVKRVIHIPTGEVLIFTKDSRNKDITNFDSFLDFCCCNSPCNMPCHECPWDDRNKYSSVQYIIEYEDDNEELL